MSSVDLQTETSSQNLAASQHHQQPQASDLSIGQDPITSGEQRNADSQTALKVPQAVNEQKQTVAITYQKDYGAFITDLRKSGQDQRSDRDQPKMLDKPTWYREDLFKNAQSVYERHFMGVNFAHLSGLLLLVRVDSVYRTLSATDQSSTVAKLFKRYYHTVRHVKCWYEGDIFDEQNEAYRSLLIVRGMHNRVSSKFNNPQSTTSQTSEEPDVNVVNKLGVSADESEKTLVYAQAKAEPRVGSETMVHISEYDIMITQFAFVGFIVIRAKKMGLLDDFSDQDLEGFLHFWRVIGYYLGASDKYNLCAYELEDVIGLCEAIKDIEFKGSIIKNSITSPPGIMSLNIVRSVKFIPMLTIYGIMRYLYEILEHETTEIEDKKNWYSNLSYTFINIVMTNFLAYKPLRAFNNGLTRLSVFLVGKVEDWFAGRLDSKYGQELRA